MECRLPGPAHGFNVTGFSKGEITAVMAIHKPHFGLSASADGRWILYPQMDQEGSDLMLVENFR